jgi:peptidyl-prolyl cis-trans isomerase B (cyclophilin B)
MNFKFFIISLIITSGFVGTASAQLGGEDFSQEEIEEMKSTAVVIETNQGKITIQLFPEDAPNHVHQFLKLVDDGFYDGVIFHRIIAGFMIQTGDPNTKDPNSDRSTWGQGGPGYELKEEFNTIKHERGIVSMARSQHVDSAGSQFFIVTQDSYFLDGQYTVFGKLLYIPGNYATLDKIATISTDAQDAPVPLEYSQAKIIRIYKEPLELTDYPDPARNQSIIKDVQVSGGIVLQYENTHHDISLHLPYRWDVEEIDSRDGIRLNMQPNSINHNALALVEKSGFTPQVLVSSEKRNVAAGEALVDADTYFSIKGGDEPKILFSNLFESEDGRVAQLLTTTQTLPTDDGAMTFKVLQMHFASADTVYSVIYVNTEEFFRYEINAFLQVIDNFEIKIDGEMQPINFASQPIFRQTIAVGKEAPPVDDQPLARVGGCLIATAAYGSELAPQVQQLRELRDNTVLQTESGATFMTGFNQFYYSFSPTIADYERENPAFKETVKLILTPLLASLALLQYADIDSEHEMLGYGIGVILLNIGMYFIAPAVLITKIRSFYKLQ